MQHVGRRFGAQILHGRVEIKLFPMGEAGRLPLDEIRPHGEVSLRQQERVFEVVRHPEIKEAEATAAGGRVKGGGGVFSLGPNCRRYSAPGMAPNRAD